MSWDLSSEEVIVNKLESQFKTICMMAQKIKALENELLEYKEAASSEAAFVNELQAENAKKFSGEEVLLAKLTIENAKLKECVEFYADLNDEVNMYDSRGVSTARQCLKDLDKNEKD